MHEIYSLVTVDDIINLSILIFYVIFICLLVIHCEFQNMHEKIERMKNEVEEPNKEQIEESSETDKEYSNVEDIIEQIKNATKKEKRIINSYLEKVIVDYIMEHEDLSELNDSTYKNKMNALEKIILLFNTISNSIQTKTKTKTE